MKKLYLFLAVILVGIIGYTAATYTITQTDQEKLDVFLNSKIIPMIEKRLKTTQDPVKQAQILKATLPLVKFVGNGGKERNATLTQMAKEQIQSKYSEIIQKGTITKSSNIKKTTSKITTKSVANNKLGDINGDTTQFANSDLIYLGRYIAGTWLSYPTDIMERGDLDTNGIINSNDVCIFQKYKVNMITTVPYTGPCPPNTTTTTTTRTANCLGSIDANGISNATSPTYTQNLTNGSRTPNYTRTYNATPGICTFTCTGNFSRNGSTCQALQGQGGSYDLKGDMTFLQSPTGTHIYTRIFNIGTADFPGNGEAKLYVDNTLIDTYEIGSLSRVGTTYTTFEDIYGVLIPGATIGQHTAKVVVTPTDNNPSNNTKEETFTLSLQNVDMSVDSVGVIKQTNGTYLLSTSIKRAVPPYQTTHLGQTITSTVPAIPTPFKLQIRLNNELIKEEIKEGSALNLLQSRQYLSFTHTVNTLPEENILKVKVISLLGNDNNTANNEKEYSFNKSSLESKADIMITDILVNDGLLLNANGERKMTINPMIKKSNGPDDSRPYKYKIFIDNNQVFESSQYGPLTVTSPRGRAPYNQYFEPGTTHTIKLQINTTQGIDPNLNNNEMTKSFTVPGNIQTSLRKPQAMPASNSTTTSFKANRIIPQTGGVIYQLDVSTNSNFTSFIPGYQNKNVIISQGNEIINDLEEYTYYYRLRGKSIIGNNYSEYSNTITVQLSEGANFSNLKLKNMYIDLGYGAHIINSGTNNFYKRGPGYDNFAPGFIRFNLKNVGNTTIQVGPAITINCKILNENNNETYNRTSIISLGGSNNPLNAGGTMIQASSLSSSIIQKLTELGNKKLSCGISNIEGRQQFDERIQREYTTKYKSSLVNFPAVAMSYTYGHIMKYYNINTQTRVDTSPIIYTQNATTTTEKILATCKQKYPNTTKTNFWDISKIEGVTFKKNNSTIGNDVIANIYKCIE